MALLRRGLSAACSSLRTCTALPAFSPALTHTPAHTPVHTLMRTPVGASQRWATSKSGGSTKNGRDSNPKFLGVKKYGGQWVEPGNIILRQRGARYGVVESTSTVGLGRDFTIFATKPGFVKFWWHAIRKKYFVEVVQSAPGVTPVAKYPIVRVKPHEVLALLRLPADTPVSDHIVEQLLTTLRALPMVQQLALVPKDATLIGDVAKKLYAPAAVGDVVVPAGTAAAEARASA